MPYSADLTTALLEALGEPALLVDRATVKAANPQAKALLGDAIVGRDVRIAIRHPSALALIMAEEAASADIVGIGSADRPWRITVSKLGPRQSLVRLSDRSDIVTAERMRTDFVANASHELRTPLATLIGYGETLAEPGPLDEGLRARFGETIHREARRMQRIVDDLMSLSRIEADRYRPPSAVVNLRDVVTASAQHATDQAQRCGCSINLDLQDKELNVAGDAAQLGQLVDNLIGNALRYGCSTPSCSVEVGLTRRGSQVLLTVRDHGDGIDPEHLPRLTERFYRIDSARSRESGGTGLGLAIVKHIVERHRGRLTIQSQRGEGTSVSVELPAT